MYVTRIFHAFLKSPAFHPLSASARSVKTTIVVGPQQGRWCSNTSTSSDISSTELSDAPPLPSAQAAAKVKPKKISMAMKAYLERAEAHDAFMSEQVHEFEIGRRHLANIMGENPETFTQEDIDKSIAYLFPSGLFEPRARPHMKHPDVVFAKRKAAEFDESGRPFHSMFYTGIPGYYQVLHDVARTVRELDNFADRMVRFGMNKSEDRSLNVSGTVWISKDGFEKLTLESIRDYQYDFFIKSMERLLEHPYAYRAQDFVNKFRVKVKATSVQEVPKLLYTAEGVPYMTVQSWRKTCQCRVTVYGGGSGKFIVNGRDILYFENIQDREQILFPLQFTGKLSTLDVVAEVEGGGTSGQSGAIRFAVSKALMSFVDKEMIEQMRLAGLLTPDWRTRERKKPGQKGARAKFTWKKR